MSKIPEEILDELTIGTKLLVLLCVAIQAFLIIVSFSN